MINEFIFQKQFFVSFSSVNANLKRASIQIMYVETVNAQDKIPTRNGLRGIFIHLVHRWLKNRRVIHYLTQTKFT